jgi:hypothetical protein
MYNDNPNILYLKNKKNSDIILSFEDKKIIDNLQLIFNECFSGAKTITYSDYSENDYLRPCLMASELLIRGWEKEAIPVIHTKKSLLSKIFGKIFD